MSTQPISSSTSAPSTNQFASGSSLSSLGSGSSLQVTGLASGLNTNAVVQALQQGPFLQEQFDGGGLFGRFLVVDTHFLDDPVTFRVAITPQAAQVDVAHPTCAQQPDYLVFAFEDVSRVQHGYLGDR